MADLLHGFSRDDLECIADALEAGYDKTVNVGPTYEAHVDTHVESTTAAAARFIRAALAEPLVMQCSRCFGTGTDEGAACRRCFGRGTYAEEPDVSGVQEVDDGGPYNGLVPRMLTSAELFDCCGGCRTNSAIETWMQRAITKFCEVNGIALGATTGDPMRAARVRKALALIESEPETAGLQAAISELREALSPYGVKGKGLETFGDHPPMAPK